MHAKTPSTKAATLYRMVMPEHICPYGLVAAGFGPQKNALKGAFFIEASRAYLATTRAISRHLFE